MTDYVQEGTFELAGCPNLSGFRSTSVGGCGPSMGGLGEPRVPGYTGGSGGGGSRGPITLQVGDKPSYDPLLHSNYGRSTGHQNYGYPTTVPGARQYRRRSFLTNLSPEGQLAMDGLGGLGGYILADTRVRQYTVARPTHAYAAGDPSVGGGGVPVAVGVRVTGLEMAGRRFVIVHTLGGSSAFRGTRIPRDALIQGGASREWLTQNNGNPSRGVLGLGTYYSTSVGGCQPCGMGEISLAAFSALSTPIKALVALAALAGAYVIAKKLKLIKPKRRNRRRNVACTPVVPVPVLPSPVAALPAANRRRRAF